MKDKSAIFIILFIVLMTSTFALIALVTISEPNDASSDNTNTNEMEVTPTPIPTIVIAPDSIEITEGLTYEYNGRSSEATRSDFVSEELGISFSVLNENSFDRLEIERTGNRVLIYNEESEKKPGQWVEVFEKEPNKTIEDAITEDFLTGYDPKDCFLNELDYNDESNSTKRLIIDYPEPEDQNQPFWTNRELCPEVYSKTNGVSYFYYDSDTPDKYAFFSIGQAAIFGDENRITWQDTFKFIN